VNWFKPVDPYTSLYNDEPKLSFTMLKVLLRLIFIGQRKLNGYGQLVTRVCSPNVRRDLKQKGFDICRRLLPHERDNLNNCQTSRSLCKTTPEFAAGAEENMEKPFRIFGVSPRTTDATPAFSVFRYVTFISLHNDALLSAEVIKLRM
jgi:hypothetical protein